MDPPPDHPSIQLVDLLADAAAAVAARHPGNCSPPLRACVASVRMDCELIEGEPGFGRLIAEVEETGERVRLTEDGEPSGVLLAAAELTALEYWVARHNKDARPQDEEAPEYPPGRLRTGHTSATAIRTAG
ncbi:hypothetical protein [Streptomyces sp. NPDC048248]|uniref:hypothetical protein n=1 Tax=Streptomyces sp. NPDC048248 TaxID=3365523 RepID=UPI00371823EA